MLRIRPKQFETLSAAPFQKLLDRWTAELRDEYPEETAEYAAPELRDLLGLRADDAAAFGLAELIHVREFLELAIRFGAPPAGAIEEPWLTGILADPESTEFEKMDRIAAALLDLDEEDNEDAADDEEPDGPTPDESDEQPEETAPDQEVDPRFDVPPDPDELEPEIGDSEEDIAW